jgi:hypothetical protein
VHHRFVVVASEQRVGCRQGRLGLAFFVDDRQIQPSFTLTVGDTTTLPPLEPGSAPRIMSSWRCASMRTISRFCTVRLTSPMCPAMRLPGNTLLGSWFWPVDPGLLCDTELPCVARLEEKLWRLMTPAKPLPMVVPLTSTFCPTLKMFTPTLEPGWSSAACSALMRNSLSTEPASVPALAKWPAAGLMTRIGRRRP